MFGIFDLPFNGSPAVILVSLTGLVLIASQNFRWLPLILGVQYIGVFLLVVSVWPVNLALVKLAAGGMVSLLIAVGQLNAPEAAGDTLKFSRSRMIFQFLIAVIVGITTYSLSFRVLDWLPGSTPELISGGIVLIGLGLLAIGLTDHVLRVFIGLLTVLAGFEIIYAGLEASVLMAGLLAGLNIGIALIGIYLLTVPSIETTE